MATVKLYNNSRLLDEPIRTLLTEASKLVGAKGSVVVKVTRGGRTGRSHARQARPYRWFLLGQRSHTSKRLVDTDGGYVVMQPRLSSDALWTAEQFWKTAVHEFAHIVQFQTHQFANGQPTRFQYQMKWAKRPQELDAVNRTDAALERLAKQPARKARVDDLIIALAIQME